MGLYLHQVDVDTIFLNGKASILWDTLRNLDDNKRTHVSKGATIAGRFSFMIKGEIMIEGVDIYVRDEGSWLDTLLLGTRSMEKIGWDLPWSKGSVLLQSLRDLEWWTTSPWSFPCYPIWWS